MTLPHFEEVVQDSQGNAVTSGVTVRVRSYAPGKPLASLFSDRDGNTGISNPVAGDANGIVSFYVASGPYELEITTPDGTRTIEYVGIGLGSEAGGLAPGLQFLFAEETADADPGDGFLRFDDADPSAASNLYISKTTVKGESVGTFQLSWDDNGNSGNRGLLYILSADNELTFIGTVTGSITDATTYVKVAITPSIGPSSGELTAEEVLGVLFLPPGAVGPTGPQGDEVKWIVQAGAPGDTADGEDGDMYLDSDTGDVYGPKTAGAWGAVAANIEGPEGPAGAGSGDVTGPAGGVVDNEFVHFDGTTGKLIRGLSLLKATAANVRASATNRVMLAENIEDASVPVALDIDTSGSVAVDWDSFINGTIAADENFTLSNPTNGQPGTWRRVQVTQDGTGSRTITFGNQYVFVGGTAPTLSTAANAVDTFLIYCRTTSVFEVYEMGLDVKAP